MKKYIISLLFLVNLANAEFIRDDNNTIVIDTITSLVWQDSNTTDAKDKNWTQAITYCEDLNISQYTAWHLPNIHELLSLSIDSNVSDVFQNIQNSYISSTTDTNTSSHTVYSIQYPTTISTTEANATTDYIRCVHDLNQ